MTTNVRSRPDVGVSTECVSRLLPLRKPPPREWHFGARRQIIAEVKSSAFIVLYNSTFTRVRIHPSHRISRLAADGNKIIPSSSSGARGGAMSFLPALLGAGSLAASEICILSLFGDKSSKCAVTDACLCFVYRQGRRRRARQDKRRIMRVSYKKKNGPAHCAHPTPPHSHESKKGMRLLRDTHTHIFLPGFVSIRSRSAFPYN